MSLPEKQSKTIAESIEEERLKLWREKRAKVAEASRQERIKTAEAERRARLETFEIEKAERVKQAAIKRAQKDAALMAERMSLARSRIAGRTDIEAARKRLMAYRARATRMLALRVTLFVIFPTLLVALYLSTMATTFYTSQAQFALETSRFETTPQGGTPFLSTGISREAHLLREVLVSPGMQAKLNTENGFTEHLSAANIDPFSRMGGPMQFIRNDSELSRHLRVSVNGQDGIISIETRATDPDKAQAFASTMMAYAQTWLETSTSADRAKNQLMRIVTPPTPARAQGQSHYLSILALAFLGFSGLYGFIAVFGRTLARHAGH